MAKRIRLGDAKAKFSAIVDEVLHDREHYIIERRGRPVAAIVRVEECERIESAQGNVLRPAGALALVGAWGEVDDRVIDAFLQDVFAGRERDTGRRITLEA